MVMSETELAEIKIESPSAKPSVKKLTLFPLIFLIFFEVSGGPFGEEPAVKAAGPLFSWLGFLIFPFIWSIPEALITAELATAYPENGGYVVWASEAFGPFWGSMMGSLKFLSGSINNAAYPVLIKDYLRNSYTQLHFLYDDVPKITTLCITTVALSVLNYLGLSVVGWVSVAIGIISLMPFLIMSLIALPKIKWHRLLSLGANGHNFKKNDWTAFLNTLFWNLNFWDNASTLAGEVENPQKTFPTALFSAGVIACLGYLIPLLAIIGSLELEQDKWENGYLADAAGMIAGPWLQYWVAIGSALSGVGLFEAQLSSSSFQAEGMANLRFLPGLFAWRSKRFNTPWVGILLSSAISLSLTFVQFEDIIAAANFLYSMGMLLEFSAFIWLRIKKPDLHRPYKVPANVPLLCIMCLIPAAFVVVVMRFSKLIPLCISAGLTFIAICNYFLMNCCKSKGCIKFIDKNNDEQVVEKESREQQ
ncbi:hypothetical protein C5167_041034 [Papaver somniferum]|uniref:Amino acid permease/ SLC12A domain-containing protein n=1 Tax=Papaver somniferum TaxID=3469 RepID=A0A4Y7IJ21_PAPSO|nr:probable polyamine transporter At3g13620 [Papaver somniferum]RZC48086.1 hypothetical protein C5167_041034 [Papaver somniferum]